MKISASGEYAIQIMADLAGYDDFVSLKDVAERQEISLKYAEKIVSKLLKAGFLLSERGKFGGYKLAKKPEECSVKDILILTGDITPIVSCLEMNCPKKETCKSITIWQKLDGLINQFLDKITISDII